MTSVRRATLVSGVVFLTIGLLRGAIQIALYARTLDGALTRVGYTVGIALFWVPVSALVVLVLSRFERRLASLLLLACGLVTLAVFPIWVSLVYAAEIGRASCRERV